MVDRDDLPNPFPHPPLGMGHIDSWSAWAGRLQKNGHFEIENVHLIQFVITALVLQMTPTLNKVKLIQLWTCS